jgi:hypothetical protein
MFRFDPARNARQVAVKLQASAPALAAASIAAIIVAAGPIQPNAIPT